LNDDIQYSVFSADTVVGIAVDDGLLALQDRPVDMFGEHLPGKLTKEYERITLENLLAMASGLDRALLMEKERVELTETAWIRCFFRSAASS